MNMELSELGPIYDSIVNFIATILIEFMIGLFVFSVFFRLFKFYIVKRQAWFVREFQRRVHLTLADAYNIDDTKISFFSKLKYVLDKTYFDIFILRAVSHRRQSDKIYGPLDKMFTIQKGSAEFIVDFLKQVRFLKKDHADPKFEEKMETTLNQNRSFGKLFGIIPVDFFDDMINVMPGIFVVGGILGTFLGIMLALPQLGNIDIANAEESRTILNHFIKTVAFAMNTSVIGIIFSILMNFVNSFFDPDNIVNYFVNDFTASVNVLWDKVPTNELTKSEIELFDSTVPIQTRNGFLEIDSTEIMTGSTKKFLNQWVKENKMNKQAPKKKKDSAA